MLQNRPLGYPHRNFVLRNPWLAIPAAIGSAYAFNRKSFNSKSIAYTKRRGKWIMPKVKKSSRKKRGPYKAKRSYSSKRYTKYRKTGRGRRKGTYRKGSGKKVTMKAVRKLVNSSKASHVNYEYTGTYVTSPLTENRWGYAEFEMGGRITKIANVLALCRTYDSATNALVTNNLATGTYHRDIAVKVQSSLVMKNNYNTPCKFDFYILAAKEATNLGIWDTYIAGMASQNIGSGDNQSTAFTPMHSSETTNLWRKVKHVSGYLPPGGSKAISYSTRWFEYDSGYFQSHSFAYQKELASARGFLMVSGSIAHNDATPIPTAVGRTKASLDVELCRKTIVSYQAGADLRDYSLTENRGTSLGNPRTANVVQPYQQAFTIGFF